MWAMVNAYCLKILYFEVICYSAIADRYTWSATGWKWELFWKEERLLEASDADRSKKTSQQLKSRNRYSKNIMVWGHLKKVKQSVALDKTQITDRVLEPNIKTLILSYPENLTETQCPFYKKARAWAMFKKDSHSKELNEELKVSNLFLSGTFICVCRDHTFWSKNWVTLQTGLGTASRKCSLVAMMLAFQAHLTTHGAKETE